MNPILTLLALLFKTALGVMLVDMVHVQVTRHLGNKHPLGFWRYVVTPLLWGMGFLLLVRTLNGNDIFLEASGFLLYASGAIVYMEFRSLLSRGYSLCVLIGLWDQGGQGEIAALRKSYGGGMGLTGLLQKRIQGLAGLHLLAFENNRVGPLTPMGRFVGGMTGAWRRLLVLEWK